MDKIIRVKEETLERLKKVKKISRVVSYDKVINALLDNKIDITEQGVLYKDNEVRDGRC